MKIGLVLSKPPVYSETFFNNKIKGLQDVGHEVKLFVQESSSSFNLCKVVKAPKVYKRSWKQFLMSVMVLIGLLPYVKQVMRFVKLERKAKRTYIQILKNIYTNAHLLRAKLDWLHFGFGTMALQSEHVAKAINSKMAVSFRGFDIDIYPLKHKNCYKLLWHEVDKVHVISHYILNKVHSYGLPKSIPIDVITPAIDKELFQANEHNFSDGSEPIIFLTVARLHWIKGLIDTLEALAILKKNRLVFQYNVIGTGLEYESIKFAIHQLDLQNEVQLLGKQNHEAIVEFMEQADIYIQYSFSEGFCNATLEAQAMGLLCIVSDVDGLQENVLHNETGIVVARRQPKLLAKAIENCIVLPLEQKQKLTTGAQKRVKDSFNLEKQQKEFLEFYN